MGRAVSLHISQNSGRGRDWDRPGAGGVSGRRPVASTPISRHIDEKTPNAEKYESQERLRRRQEGRKMRADIDMNSALPQP